jgi:hypothetical protein
MIASLKVTLIHFLMRFFLHDVRAMGHSVTAHDNNKHLSGDGYSFTIPLTM